jgi:predicted nuclease of restriction endonuclease-like (RecB) superfamily
VARQLQSSENQINKIVSPLVTQLTDIRNTILAQIGWTHHLIIFARTKTAEEREFYIRLCIRERYSKRELDRQISNGLFERVMLGKQQLPAAVKQSHQEMLRYAMNRTLSPTLVASYQTQLPDKNILQQKWRQIMEETTK